MIEDRGSQHYLFDDRVDNPIIAFNRNKGAPGNFEPPRRLRRRGAKQGWLFEPATGPFPPHGRRRFEVLHNGILALVLGRFWARMQIQKCQPLAENAPRNPLKSAMERARMDLPIALSNRTRGASLASGWCF